MTTVVIDENNYEGRAFLELLRKMKFAKVVEEEISIVNDAVNDQSRPCQYTMAELKAGIPEFIKEIENDDLIPFETIKRK